MSAILIPLCMVLYLCTATAFYIAYTKHRPPKDEDEYIGIVFVSALWWCVLIIWPISAFFDKLFSIIDKKGN